MSIEFSDRRDPIAAQKPAAKSDPIGFSPADFVSVRKGPDLREPPPETRRDTAGDERKLALAYASKSWLNPILIFLCAALLLGMITGLVQTEMAGVGALVAAALLTKFAIFAAGIYGLFIAIRSIAKFHHLGFALVWRVTIGILVSVIFVLGGCSGFPPPSGDGSVSKETR